MKQLIQSGIYKIVNNKNGKIYIGQSSNLDSRWVKHKHFLDKNKHHNKHLQFAWNKYGANVFSFEVIERCPCNMLDERETYWIKKLDSLNNGYNLDLGGLGIRGYKHTEEEINKMRRIQQPLIILQFDEDLNFIKEWIGGASQVYKELKYTKKAIEDRCRHSCDGMSLYKNSYWIYKKEYESDNFNWDLYLNNIPAIKFKGLFSYNMKEPICQYSLDKELIKTWHDYGEMLDAGYDIDRVRGVCNRYLEKTKTHKGFIWCYESYDFSDGFFDVVINKYQKTLMSKKAKRQTKSVAMLDESGKIIREFKSAKFAALSLTGRTGITNSIVRACNNPHKTSFNHHWKYAT